ncbi:hypothetical protein R3P38DRAFT_3363171 [Favolaschia claudopus]|uniref:Uncharacterized protein n=1 Tax=Favolaschia claudopus TaxID=2862362 RepID=A0AAW0AKM1_9AGAR
MPPSSAASSRRPSRSAVHFAHFSRSAQSRVASASPAGLSRASLGFARPIRIKRILAFPPRDPRPEAAPDTNHQCVRSRDRKVKGLALLVSSVDKIRFHDHESGMTVNSLKQLRKYLLSVRRGEIFRRYGFSMDGGKMVVVRIQDVTGRQEDNRCDKYVTGVTPVLVVYDDGAALFFRSRLSPAIVAAQSLIRGAEDDAQWGTRRGGRDRWKLSMSFRPDCRCSISVPVVHSSITQVLRRAPPFTSSPSSRHIMSGSGSFYLVMPSNQSAPPRSRQKLTVFAVADCTLERSTMDAVPAMTDSGWRRAVIRYRRPTAVWMVRTPQIESPFVISRGQSSSYFIPFTTFSPSLRAQTLLSSSLVPWRGCGSPVSFGEAGRDDTLLSHVLTAGTSGLGRRHSLTVRVAHVRRSSELRIAAFSSPAGGAGRRRDFRDPGHDEAKFVRTVGLELARGASRCGG